MRVKKPFHRASLSATEVPLEAYSTLNGMTNSHFPYEKMTPYAKSIALTGGEYWLRSLGKEKGFAATVTDKGQISVAGGDVSMQIYGVRPALWISEK